MKKIIAIAMTAVICLSLTSCVFKISSVDNLMRPPKLSGESSLLQEAFEKTVSNKDGIIMKTPISGENRSSYLFVDFESDGIEEAIVFFSDPLNDINAFASVFKFVDNEWKYVSQAVGKGEEIYEVNFADINGDGTLEILLSWTGASQPDMVNSSDFGNSVNRILTVYGYDGATISLIKTDTYTNLFFEDLNGDDSDELILFRINLNDVEKRTTASVLNFNADYSVQKDETLTLTGFIEIANIVTDIIEHNGVKHTRIYVDGMISEIGVITEIIDVAHNSFEISIPLYEQNQSSKPLTLRDTKVYSSDIDNDGKVEIPTFEKLPLGARIPKETSERKELNLTVWSEFTDNIIIKDFKCLFSTTYGYYFIYSDDLKGKMTAIYDENNLTLTFYEISENGTVRNSLFSFKIFFEPNWDEDGHNYTKLNEKNMYVFAYMIADDANSDFYENLINNNFKLIN